MPNIDLSRLRKYRKAAWPAGIGTVLSVMGTTAFLKDLWSWAPPALTTVGFLLIFVAAIYTLNRVEESKEESSAAHQDLQGKLKATEQNLRAAKGEVAGEIREKKERQTVLSYAKDVRQLLSAFQKFRRNSPDAIPVQTKHDGRAWVARHEVLLDAACEYLTVMFGPHVSEDLKDKGTVFIRHSNLWGAQTLDVKGALDGQISFLRLFANNLQLEQIIHHAPSVERKWILEQIEQALAPYPSETTPQSHSGPESDEPSSF